MRSMSGGLPQRLKNSLCLSAVVAVSLLGGCGESGPEKPKLYPVSGTVTLDGQPLADGSIVLDPEDGKSIASQGGIKDGAFKFESPEGPKIVRISASKETGEKDEYGSLISVSLVAPEFNSQSGIKVNIAAGENKDLKFEVKSPPPAQ